MFQPQSPKPTLTRGGPYRRPQSASNYSVTSYNFPPPSTHAGTGTSVHYPAPCHSTWRNPPCFDSAPTNRFVTSHKFVVSHKPAPNLTQIALTPSDNSAENITPGKCKQLTKTKRLLLMLREY